MLLIPVLTCQVNELSQIKCYDTIWHNHLKKDKYIMQYLRRQSHQLLIILRDPHQQIELIDYENSATTPIRGDRGKINDLQLIQNN